MNNRNTRLIVLFCSMAIHPNQWYIATGQASGLSVDQNELVSHVLLDSLLIKKNWLHCHTILCENATVCCLIKNVYQVPVTTPQVTLIKWQILLLLALYLLGNQKENLKLDQESLRNLLQVISSSHFSLSIFKSNLIGIFNLIVFDLNSLLKTEK